MDLCQCQRQCQGLGHDRAVKPKLSTHNYAHYGFCDPALPSYQITFIVKYYMGKLLNIPVMLLNPALGQDDTLFDAYSEIDKTGDLQSKVYLGVGENDDVISPLKTVDFLLHETDEFDINNYMKGEHTHRTPVEFFKDFALKFLPMINNNE